MIDHDAIGSGLDVKDFMILFPQDGHMPSIAMTKPEYVKKVVAKIPIETMQAQLES
jgi:beta-galactosidase beta subunit